MSTYPPAITIRDPDHLRPTLDLVREKLARDDVRRELISAAADHARREREAKIAAALHFRSTIA